MANINDVIQDAMVEFHYDRDKVSAALIRRKTMRVDSAALRQQAWIAERLFDEMYLYAKKIGCEFFQDEIICDTEEKARLLARWWTEHTS